MKTTKYLLRGDASLEDLMKMYEATMGRRPTPAEIDDCSKILNGPSLPPPVSGTGTQLAESRSPK